MHVTTRPARPEDADAIFAFVEALSVYEKLEHLMEATPRSFRDALFCDAPRVFCELALVEGEVAGVAIWFYNFSTFLGRHGLYLEDLFVDPHHRGVGAGKALLAALARRCVDEGLGRFEWSVLDWNTPAIDFYRAQGADINHGWLPVRLTGAALAKLAEAAR
ncbi:GNAT family N-acetyltransferase [Oryzibacter oryziterrae]|uniref:GNAT family N-acetyltransferase n=1 Tax=Oryzibacter oryziterrae TaxID=2766474 RepID=UPI001F350CDD|nr:GNAT family N-acetyltransferase [Oryzibacter oryziterrae]